MKDCRYLSEECKSCPDNTCSIGYCFDICMIPLNALEEIEKKNKERGNDETVHA